jgi:hypothetical protein
MLVGALLVAFASGCSDSGESTQTTSTASTSTVAASTTPTIPVVKTLNALLSQSKCTGAGRVPLTKTIVNAAELEYIEPYSGFNTVGTLPRFAQYWDFKGQGPVAPDALAVMAPGAGTIVRITKTSEGHEIVIEHTCDTYSIVSDVARLTGPLTPLDNTLAIGQIVNDRIVVEAGQIFGLDGEAPGIGYALLDQTATPPTASVAPTIATQPWIDRVVAPLDYFSAEAATQVREALVGTVVPPDGTTAIQIDGSAQGPWRTTDGERQIVLVGSNLDPKAAVVSFGNDIGSQNYLVSKWPESVSSFDELTATDGVVVLDLATFNYVRTDGKAWSGDNQTRTKTLTAMVVEPYGYLLLQVGADNTMRAEILPGSESPRVGFSAAAVTYSR